MEWNAARDLCESRTKRIGEKKKRKEKKGKEMFEEGNMQPHLVK